MSTSSHRYIKEQQVNRMLRLENLFHQRYLTAELLNQLVATYVEAIECFDGFYSPMRKYFLQKIQYVVSQPQIDSMLKRNVQNDNMVGALRQTIRMTTDNISGSKIDNNNDHSQQIFSHSMLMQAIQAEQKKVRLLHQKNQKASKQRQKQQSNNSNNKANDFYMKSPDNKQPHIPEKSESQKAHQRQKKIEMQLNFMKQVSQNMKNLELQVQKQDKNFIKKTKRINALMQQQNSSLQARLAMRKKGKGRKKSNDQKFMQQVKQVMPAINKQQLRQAQKQIAQAVLRMTARLTQRMGTNKGVTGMIVGGGNNEEKYRGRIKIKNQVREEEDQDDQQEELLIGDNNMKKVKNVTNVNVNVNVNDKKGGEQNKVIKQEEKNINKVQQKKQQPQANNEGTGRFTLGGESGGRGRIKRRDTNRLDEDDQ